MERMKIQNYNKKQEDMTKRKKEKEFEIHRALSQKARSQEEREKRLKVTKERYESQTEGFKNILSEKLNKINERVSI
jgi:hypothetical protein